MAATPKQKVGWGAANVLVVVVAIIPLLWIVSLSFKDPATITSATFWPKKWTLENYRGIFRTSEFTRALVNSIGIALISNVHRRPVRLDGRLRDRRLTFPGKGALIGCHCSSRCSRRSRWSRPCSTSSGRCACSTPGRGSSSRT